MAEKIVTEYLKARREAQKGAKSPYIKFSLAKLDDLPTENFDYEIRAKDPLSGLICRVRSSGVKSLEVFKKPSGSYKPVRIKLGRVGELPLTGTNRSVKKKLQSVLNDLSEGINPNEKRRLTQLQDEAESLTVQVALDDYLEASDLKESTSNNYRSGIESHFADELGLQLASLMDKDLLAGLHKRITKKSGPYAANSVMRVLRAITNDAREEIEDRGGDGMHLRWPIQGKKKNKRFWNGVSPRTGWIKPEYLKDWWKATEALPKEYLGNGELARDYLQFVLLSGLRRREATSLLWEDIDFKTKSFKIMDTKNRKTLELPCSDYMMKILKRRQGHSELGPFELHEPKKFVTWVRKKSGVEFTIHDLRRSFITYAESLDFGAYTIKALVNHSTGNSRDVTEGYLQLSVERLRKPMQKISSYVLAQRKKEGVTSLGRKADG